MTSVKIWRSAALVALGVAVTLAVQAAIANPAPTTLTGNDLIAVKAVRESGFAETHTTAWQNIPGAAATVTVPDGTQAIVLADFTGTAFCTTTDPNIAFVCSVRILVDGVPAEPSAPGTFGNTGVSFVAQSVDQSSGPLPPGKHVVRAQFRVGGVSPGHTSTLRVGPWHFTVEAFRVSA